MSNLCIYVIVVLTVILVIIGAYLSMIVISLKNEVNALRTGMLRSVSEYYESLTKPMLYISTYGNYSFVALYLNITNPTNELMNITINIITIQPPIPYQVFLAYPMAFIIPPKTTVSLPVILNLFNSSMNNITNINITITILTNELANLRLPGVTYNVSIIEVIPMKQPMGIAFYGLTQGSLFSLRVMDPLSSSMTIISYEMYAYNGSLLTSCILSKSLVINPMSFTGFSLPTRSGTFSTLFIVNMPSSRLETSFSASTICTVNYTLPTNDAELPYGYVMLNTNIGNITIPLIPFPPIFHNITSNASH
ncbi:hypothetical protein [Vulcanisaeta moutnovskia]|uniref:hypothetical protein n=1 Tax=Vulcanisaeta moutnovskia TaxID=985052 RepID=UPI00064EFEAE|nr:hypothetical protein [Vulcanisaeta moutnovskia]